MGAKEIVKHVKRIRGPAGEGGGAAVTGSAAAGRGQLPQPADAEALTQEEAER